MTGDFGYFLVLLILVLLTFFCPLLSKGVRKDPKYYLMVMFFLVILHGISIFNAYFGTLKGAGNDALSFHLRAVEWAADGSWEFVLSHQLYSQILGALYRLTSPGLFLAQELSILAYSLTCIFLHRLIRLNGVLKHRFGILLLYSILPGMLLVCSITLREPFQILFLMMVGLYGSLLIQRYKHLLFFKFLLANIAVAVSHKALMVYIVFLLLSILIIKMPTSRPWAIRKSKLMLIVFFISIILTAVFVLPKISNVSGFYIASVVATADLEVMDNVLDTKANMGARTTYEHRVNFNGPMSFLWSLLLSVMYYLFMPFPWQISSFTDLYGFAEAQLRLFLVLSLYPAIRTFYGLAEIKRARFFLILMYFTLAILWAAGTSNIGTAFRHNLTHNWILILLAYPWLKQRLNQTLVNMRS